MTAQPAKKKRYEGLIQFQDPLRQALVCLQAALGERFVSGAHLERLKQMDSNLVSHFLLTSDGHAVGDLQHVLEARHLLMRIEQIDGTLPIYPPSLDSQVNVWLDSSDALTAQYLFQLLAQAVDPSVAFGLNQGSGWSAHLEKWQGLKKSSGEQPWLNPERLELLRRFQDDTQPLFKSIKNQSLMSDGCSVALMMEGPTHLKWDELAAASIHRLPGPDRHLLAVNYVSGAQPWLQCAYLTPMRLPLKGLQTASLKGFILLRDIKLTVKMP